MARWLIRAAVSAAVAVVLLLLVPLHDVLEAISRISIWTWCGSLIVFFAGQFLNAVKLRMLIGAESVPLFACVQAQYAGQAANLGLPGLAGGDFVRAAYLVPRAGAKRVAVASVADRVLDTVTLLILVALALPVAGVPDSIRGVVPLLELIAAVAIAAGTIAAMGFLVFGRRHPTIARHLESAASAFRKRRAALLVASVISLLVQATFALTNAWLAREVGVTTGIAAWFVAWPLSKLIAVLPISLGGIGVREAALVSLMVPYGAPSDAVLASGILWQTVLAASGIIGLVATQWWWRSAAVASGLGKVRG